MLAPGGWARANYRVLYSFQGGRDGFFPSGWPIWDRAGNLYGVTEADGLGGNDGCGTVFELRKVKGGWSHKVLYRFPGDARDGCDAEANLAFDVEGNLYGTTLRGGGQGNCTNNGKDHGCGTVYELAPARGGKWRETVVHRFAGGSDGAHPFAGVVFDAAGNAYGTTGNGGGTCDCGTVFELSRGAVGGWTQTILHSFSGTDGADPTSLAFGPAGDLYGLTNTGGAYGEGVAFELTPAAGGWREVTIYNFGGFGDGAGPGNGLTPRGRSLYGATEVGGASDYGTVFELKPGTDGGWTHTVLYSFTGQKDGVYPASPFVFDESGNLYGSTGGDVSCTKGNRWGCGNVFELMPRSGGQWKLRVLHTFAGGSSGGYPGQPMIGPGGSLYGFTVYGNCGTDCGLVFEVKP